MMLLPRPNLAPPVPPPWAVGRGSRFGQGNQTGHNSAKQGWGQWARIGKSIDKRGLNEQAILTFVDAFTVFFQNDFQIDLSDFCVCQLDEFSKSFLFWRKHEKRNVHLCIPWQLVVAFLL